MARKIKDLLANKAEFPDDMRVTIAGEEISFGELRRQDAESQGEISRSLQTRATELDQKEALQARAVTTLATVLENVSRTTGLSYDQLVSGQVPENLRETVAATVANTRTTSGVALKDDPLYKPVFDYLAPMQEDLGNVKKAVGTAIGAYVNDRARLTYLEMKDSGELPEGFKMPYKEALQLAVNKGYKDDIGAPDVARAMREAAGPVSTKAAEDARYNAGIEEGRKQAAMDSLQRLGAPQSGSGGIHFEPAADGKTQKTASIADKLNEAFSDPTIAAGLFGRPIQ